MGWAEGGPGELQKLKGEDLSCSRPWPDLEYLPLLLETPGRQWDRRQTAQTESSQQGPRFPQGQGRGTMPDWGQGWKEWIPQSTSHVPGSTLTPGTMQVACAQCPVCTRHGAGRASEHPQNSTLRQVLQCAPVYT